MRENRGQAAEIKFLVSPALAGEIRDWARVHLSPDPNATEAAGDGYQITSLYFDTEAFDVFQRRGSFGRSKYRIRRYGESEVAFLERKLKTRGQLSKRRSTISLGTLERLNAEVPERGWAGHWFHRRLSARRLGAICQISYWRTARVALTNYGPMRLTLDYDLRAQPAAGLWFSEAEGRLILPDHVILELKFRAEMPLCFKQLVERFALNSQPISKYRRAVASLGLLPQSAVEIQPNENLKYA